MDKVYFTEEEVKVLTTGGEVSIKFNMRTSSGNRDFDNDSLIHYRLKDGNLQAMRTIGDAVSDWVVIKYSWKEFWNGY